MIKSIRTAFLILLTFMCLNTYSSDLRLESPWLKSGTTIRPYSLLDYVGIGVTPTSPLHISTTNTAISANIAATRNASGSNTVLQLSLADSATTSAGFTILSVGATQTTASSITNTGASLVGAQYNITVRGNTTVIANSINSQTNSLIFRVAGTHSFTNVVTNVSSILTSGGDTGTHNYTSMVNYNSFMDFSNSTGTYNVDNVIGFYAGDNSLGGDTVAGTIINNVGMKIDQQGLAGPTLATNNIGLWLNGNDIGADIMFGTSKSARGYYNGTNLFIDPNLVGTGHLDIGGFVTNEGQKRVSTQFDKTDITLTNITGLSATVVAGHFYKFEARLFIDASAIGGSKYAIDGGATATNVIYHVKLVDDTTGLNTITSRQTALAGAGVGQAGTTAGFCEISGFITVNAGGTLTVQFAQNVANGTSSVLVGSTFIVEEIN